VSYQGQTWVDEVALPLLKNTGELIIMLRVANHAGNGPNKMSGCFAGSKTLAKECLMSPRAAQGHLRELSRRHLLIPGDPKLVEHMRPDLRTPVYDLAGAHHPGCPGGHDINGDCQPSDTGSRFCHPLGGAENSRSAGSRNDHPSPGSPASGSKKRQQRVAESATKSSKELKEFSPLSGDSPSPDVPSVAGEGTEREAAAQDSKDVDQVLDAFIASYMRTAGLPPRPDAIRSVRTDAAALLSVGRSVDNLSALADELGARGWTDLVKHAQMNPEAARPAGVSRPWCGECNGGFEPVSAAQRMVETPTGMAKCSCHPGYIPTQAVHA